MKTTKDGFSSFEIRRWPWGGLLALLIVAAVDTIALGPLGPWESLRSRVRPQFMLEYMTIGYRRELRQLDEERGNTRIFIVGSSRAMLGFQLSESDRRDLGSLSFVHYTYPGNGAFEIRSAVDEMLDYDPDIVVWMLSEFDTHRPVWLLPQTSYASFSAIRDLLRAAGVRFGLAQRVALERLAVKGVSNAYRYRRLLEYAGLARVRRFRFDERYARSVPIDPEPALFDGTPTTYTQEQYQQVLASLEANRNPRALAQDMDRVRRITRGRHSEVNTALLRRAVARLRDAGVRVIVVETPLSPAAAALYDTSIRLDFLEFMNELITEYGVRFVPLELIGPFAIEDFRDLSHAAEPGRVKLTRAVLKAVHDELDSTPSIGSD